MGPLQEVTLDEAKANLRELIDAAVKGETVLISKDGHQKVQLVPIAPQKRHRQPGSAKGLITMAEDFDAPLADFDESLTTRSPFLEYQSVT
jgi:prevent-host-death family protein